MAAPAKTKAAPSGAAEAAQAEATGTPKTYEWRGLTFDLPAKLPGVLAFDFAALEEAENEFGPVVRFVQSLLGDENTRLVRAKVAEDEIPFDEIAGELLGLINGVFAVYGMAEGDSDASQES
jgi:hypothetical protein